MGPHAPSRRARLGFLNPDSARATVFGLDVRAELPLRMLREARAQPTGRELALTVGESDARIEWPSDAERISDELAPDGSLSLCIEAHREAGYLISGPQFGAHLLSRDGRKVRCAPRGAPAERWERLLIAQVLPFAAVVRGLEVFHASAVTLNEEALAFIGPSRAGKTSVALELCARGASFLADDVLALECQDDRVYGHAGSPIASLDRLAPAHEPLSLDRPLTIDHRERLVSVEGAAHPAPLRALFFLDRRPDGPPSPRFEPVADPRTLLAATFNFVLATPERLHRLLDVCALAAQRRVERVVIGPDVTARKLGSAVIRRLGTCR
jgi:hypothetical protein